MAFHMRQSKFRHVFGKPYRRENCYEGIHITKISHDSAYCAVNKKYLAVLCDAGRNSSFLVHDLTKVGRLAFGDLPLVAGHRGEVLDIAWDPFNDNIIASCGEDFSVKIWEIPEGGLEEHMETPVASLELHDKRASVIKWHPVAKNILISAGFDFQMFVWNVEETEALVQIDCHPDLIYSISFNWIGDRIVTTCKDKKIRIIDARTGDIVTESKGHEGAKPSHVVFLKDGNIFTTGFSRRSERQYALWNGSDLKQLMTDEIDSNNGPLWPIYDPDLELIYLVGKGDSLIRYYEVTKEEPYVHYLSMFQSNTPQRGFGFMPKRGCNVNQNEIMRIYKMMNNGMIEPIPFIVPRKSEQFQEDIYPETRSDTPALTPQQWFDENINAEPNMQPMSDLFEGDVKTKSKLRVRGKPGERPRSMLESRAAAGDKGDAAPALPKSNPPAESSESAADKLREQRREAERREAEREAERKEQEKREQERREATRRELDRREAELKKKEIEARKEAERLEAERKEAEAMKRESASSSASDLPEGFSYQAMMDDIRKLKLIAKAHDRRIKTLEERLAEYENGAEELEVDAE